MRIVNNKNITPAQKTQIYNLLENYFLDKQQKIRDGLYNHKAVDSINLDKIKKFIDEISIDEQQRSRKEKADSVSKILKDFKD